jgi:hypothetical protein
VRTVRAASFASGTTMLAKKMSAASGHDPVTTRNTTPLMMVSVCAPNSEPVSITGRTLAGI